MTEIPSVGSTPVYTVTGEPVMRLDTGATIADVAKAIADGQFGAVLIGDDRPVGMVSERDVVRVVASGQDPAAVRAVDVASTKLVWCAADDTVDEVAVRMMDHYIRHVLVERDGELIGIVSARDLLGVYSAAADLPSSPA